MSGRADTDLASRFPTVGRLILILILVLVLAWMPVLLGLGTIAEAASLHELADARQPYCVPEHALLLYVLAPLVAASACILFLLPGLLLVPDIWAVESVGHWILWGLALSIVVIGGVTGAVQAGTGWSPRGHAFAVLVASCGILCGAILAIRSSRGTGARWPRGRPGSKAAAVAAVGMPILIFVALLPKFLWESFNGDGAHAFEAARLLLVQAVPFWPAGAGEIAELPGTTSMLFAFPASWFIRLFGEIEASARIPLLLYLAATCSGLAALVEHGRGPIQAAEIWLIWLGLAVYTVVMVFSATYSPYSADLALPATQDTLLMACYLGFVLAFVERRRDLEALLLVLTYTAAPNGLLLIGLWLVAGFVLSFGEDVTGELYVLTKECRGPESRIGRVLKIIPAG